jgi:hypothetical protein
MHVADLRKRIMDAAMVAAFCFMANAAHAQLVKSVATPTQPAAAQLTDRQACSIEKQDFPALIAGVAAVHFVKDGLLLDQGRNKHVTLAYAEMKKVEYSPGVFFHADLLVHMQGKWGSYAFIFPPSPDGNAKAATLQNAVNTLMLEAQAGKTVICSDNPQDYDEELADFQVKTAAWRALATKPPVSDEVYKDRLLAEDALKTRNLASAAKYYELGVAADPTWDQGWYNAALVYADLNDYFDAAVCMRHYVALMPNATDVQAAKDNIILWEAKAPQPTSVASEPAKRGGFPNK